MNFTECLTAVGVKEYPEYLPEIYERLSQEGRLDDMTVISEEFVRSANEKYGFFDHSLPAVLASVREMRRDPALVAYINTLAEALIDRELIHEAGLPEIPIPTSENIAYNFAGFVAMLPAAINADKIMRERSFPEEVIRANYRHFEYCIDTHESRFDFPALSDNYFGWLQRYLDAVIMEYRGYRFELVPHYSDRAILLQNKAAGEFAVLMPDKMMHRDGAVLGSASYEDENGAYLAEFYECEEYYEGYPCGENGYCTGEKIRFSRPEWEIVMRPGDPVLNTHFPKGCNLKGTAFSDACRDVIDVFKRSFPSFEPRAFVCCSWLLDPRIDEICGGAPNILNFQSHFRLFPIKDSGQDVFKFVFLKPFKSYDELPEDTRLMRGLKKHYIGGGYVLDFGGIIPLTR